MVKVKTEAAPTRKMSKKTRLQAFMHQEIFTAAARAMEKAGFSVVTMDDVAREMGGSKGTIYYYFSSREELISSMAMHCFKIISDALQPIADNKKLTAAEKLEQMVRTEVLVMCQNWLLQRALWTNAWWSGLDDKNAQVIGRGRTAYVKYLAGLLSEIDKGRDKKLNYETRARMIFYSVESVTGWFTGGGPVSAEKAADEAVNILLGNIIKK